MCLFSYCFASRESAKLSHSAIYQLCSLRQGFPGGSVGKESACNAGDPGSIPGLGRSPGEGKGHSLRYSGLENSMDCIVPGVAKSQIRLSDFHFHVLRRSTLPLLSSISSSAQ